MQRTQADSNVGLFVLRQYIHHRKPSRIFLANLGLFSSIYACGYYFLTAAGPP